jgi:hypothetical protein
MIFDIGGSENLLFCADQNARIYSLYCEIYGVFERVCPQKLENCDYEKGISLDPFPTELFFVVDN